MNGEIKPGDRIKLDGEIYRVGSEIFDGDQWRCIRESDSERVDMDDDRLREDGELIERSSPPIKDVNGRVVELDPSSPQAAVKSWRDAQDG